MYAGKHQDSTAKDLTVKLLLDECYLEISGNRMQEGDALLKKVSKNIDTVIDPARGPMLSGVEILAVGQIKEEFANFRRCIIF